MDVAAFGDSNRCPLWRGRLNRWVLRRTLLGRPSDDEILRGVSDALAVWFDPSKLWGVPQLVGNVRRMRRRRPLELDGEVAATTDLLSSSPTMLGDSFASLSVEFLYFGQCVDMPWPVLDSFGRWEPFDCVWCVDLVGAPDGC